MTQEKLARWIDHLDIALEQMEEESVEAEFVEDVVSEMVDDKFEEAQDNAR